MKNDKGVKVKAWAWKRLGSIDLRVIGNSRDGVRLKAIQLCGAPLFGKVVQVEIRELPLALRGGRAGAKP